MSDRWFIFKEGKALGPFTPEEIRASLREGTFDPFDLVTREGSSVRRELVEVDELFFSSKIVYADEGPSANDPQQNATVDSSSKASPSLSSLPALRDTMQASPQSTDLLAGQGLLALAQNDRHTVASQAPSRIVSGQAHKRRRDPKHFHLLDSRGRMLGPIGAGEIQSLFYKGVLDKSVRVMRDGSKAQVPVSRFVAIYSETNKVRRAMQQGAHPAMKGGLRSSAMRMGGHRAAGFGQGSGPFSGIAIVAIIAAILLSSVAAYVFYKHGAVRWLARDGGEVQQQETPKAVPRARLAPGEEERQRHEQAMRTRRSVQVPARVAPPVNSSRDSRLAELRRQKVKLLEMRRQRERELRNKKKLVKATVAPVPKGNKSTIAVTPKALPAPAPSPAPAPTPPPKPAGQTVGSLTDGQQVAKLGPMTFSKAALDSCEGSCNIAFTGAGGTVKVAFFKQVWASALTSKSGGIYLSGLVKKNGGEVKIILSNVQ